MKLEILEKLEPKFAEKIKRDFDLHEIRGESFTIIEKWLEKALMIEATLFMLRADVLQVVGVKEISENFYEPNFKFVFKKTEDPLDNPENDDILFEEE
jgi:hypothetical protein